ncbi:class I adenylate-forming enzyme family protein [Chelativorans sp. YIM 93263]|uniref:class I adenylate-forming enzyme family protein n=1 Tax=Chelativorans sp. YIM 93263 TaxID=2906648 RepID=UPI002379AD4B|nr:class I adenylate-forming enzyme family protein [Chelativorans sp. YIM 93263]
MILGRSLLFTSQRFADRTAVACERVGEISHKAFAQRVYRIADGMKHLGIQKGDRVGMLARNSADYLAAYFAIGSIGAWFVPLNTALKVADIDFRLSHAEVSAFFVDREFLPVYDGLAAKTRKQIDGRIVVMGGPTDRGWALEELLETAKPIPPDVSISPEDVLYVGYTSGTTGTPKGALVSHRAIVGGFLYKALEYGLTDKDVTINAGPYWHSAPRDFASLAIYLGGTSVVPRKFEPQTYLELAEKYSATNSFLVPTMLQRIVREPDLDRRDLSKMRCLISGGAPLPSTTKERVLEKFGPALTEFYGATETRIVTTITPDELAVRERSVGRPVLDVEVAVFGKEGEHLPAGKVGEVFIRGPGLFSGYWRDDERTAAAHRGDWFSLGDMGRFDEDGFLYLVDRKQDMIISGGENIYPNDIEECIRRLPGVAEAGVVGEQDEEWGEVVVAFVVPESGREVIQHEVTDHCRNYLPNYMIPKRVIVTDSLPRNEVGKILRRELRRRLADASTAVSATTA